MTREKKQARKPRTKRNTAARRLAEGWKLPPPATPEDAEAEAEVNRLLFPENSAEWYGEPPDAKQIAELMGTTMEELKEARHFLSCRIVEAVTLQRLARLVAEAAAGVAYQIAYPKERPTKAGLCFRGMRAGSGPDLFDGELFEYADRRTQAGKLADLADLLEAVTEVFLFDENRRTAAELRRQLPTWGTDRKETLKRAATAQRCAFVAEARTAAELLSLRTLQGRVEGVTVARMQAGGKTPEEIEARLAKARQAEERARKAKEAEIVIRLHGGGGVTDTAKEAGVSKATVSRIANTPRIRALFDRAGLPLVLKRGRPIGSRKNTHGGEQGEDEMDRQQARKWEDEERDGPDTDGGEE